MKRCRAKKTEDVVFSSEFQKMRQLYELLRDRFSFVEKMCGKLSDDVRMVCERLDKHEKRLIGINADERRTTSREIITELLERLQAGEDEGDAS